MRARRNGAYTGHVGGQNPPRDAVEERRRRVRRHVLDVEAHAWLDHKYQNLFTPPYYEGTHWGLPASKEVLEMLRLGREFYVTDFEWGGFIEALSQKHSDLTVPSRVFSIGQTRGRRADQV
jgi:hypothetical protein